MGRYSKGRKTGKPFTTENTESTEGCLVIPRRVAGGKSKPLAFSSGQLGFSSRLGLCVLCVLCGEFFGRFKAVARRP